MSSVYRVYVRFGDNDCLRFLAPGNGIIEKDGLQLFEWIRDPRNIARLRKGLQHVYELDRRELPYFLKTKLHEDRGFRDDQMVKDTSEGDMLATLGQEYDHFNSLETGVEKLEAISNATGITVIPRTAPRQRTDQPGWLYLLDLFQGILEVYEFKDYKPDSLSPFSRLTIESLYQRSPSEAPGYYIRLKMSEIQAMWRSEWVTIHETHAEALDQLWKCNIGILRTVPHADTLPFAVLYGSGLGTEDWNVPIPCRLTKITQATLTRYLAGMNRRRPSAVPIFERKCLYDPSQKLAYKRPQGVQQSPFELRKETLLERQRRRRRKTPN